jgi:hypothetical protein
MLTHLLGNMAIWGVLGACLLNVIVVVVYRTGLVHTARKKDGTLKRKVPIAGLLIMLAMLLLTVAFIVLFDYSTFSPHQPSGVAEVLLVNFAFVLLLVLYDSLVIDILVLGLWRPAFLHLPAELTLESMVFHVKKQFTVGWLFIVPVVFVSALIFTYSVVPQ